ncbi:MULTISPECIES: HAD family hydrolase [unclassified Carboxylicivirga]|uniref:HAD family hydrolase n=1 Tax=Carboxylicivirga TaxID=1628153 RepID=UPI003D3347AF
MIKMIVSDMDGTLLNSDKQLPHDFAEVYRMMQAAGIQFVVASGRQYYTLVNEFKHLNHNISFIAENGGFINWQQQSKLTKALKASDARDIIQTFRSLPGVNIVLCGKGGAYVENTESKAFIDEMSKYYVKHTVVDDLLSVDDDILKIAVNDFHNLEETVYPLAMEKHGDDYQISASSPIWLDVMPKGVNKGKAIRLLQDEMGIRPEETMAFGDYLNDLEMLQTVHHSYAMANAHPLIKETARFATDSNDNNGVMKAIRRQLAEVEPGKE